MNSTKRASLILIIGCISFISNAQSHLVGYWHNWNDGSAPYINLDQVDNRYTVVNLSFAEPTGGTDYNMAFTPCCGETQAGLISKIQTLQSNGVIVNISIGGANAPIHLDNTTERDAFVATMTTLIDTYGLDGLDVDLEGASLSVTAATTIANPTDANIVNMISAIQQIMANYQATNGKKLFLSTAPETAFVQGGQSNWGGIWGAYLPLIDALRTEWDLVHVQLYNSGSMYGIDGAVYAQGSADFIVSQVEAMIVGFDVDQWTNQAGHFDGLPENIVNVGLPACPSAAGGGFTSPAVVKSAIDYLMGNGPKPGSYTLAGGPYPNLGGMMTWSINWDAVSSCNASSYEFAANYEDIFQSGTCWQPNLGNDLSACSLTFPHILNSQTSTNSDVTFTWKNTSTNQTIVNNSASANTLSITETGTYQVTRDSLGCSKIDIINVTNNLASPDLPATYALCETLPAALAVGNPANFPSNTTWEWYLDNTSIAGATTSSYTDIRQAGTYKVIATSGSCTEETETIITSGAPSPMDDCGMPNTSLDLAITSNSAGPFAWYATPTGGTALANGMTYTTPSLTSTTTYYVEDESSVGSATTGPASTGNSFGTRQNWASPTEVIFDTEAAIILQELTIFPLIWCNSHSLNLEIQDAAGVALSNGVHTFSVTDDDGDCATVNATPITITFPNGGVNIPQGTGYKIVVTGAVGIDHYNSSITFPMSYSPYFEITGSNVTGRLLAIHDWKVSGGSCARMPVIAEISTNCSAILPVEWLSFDARLVDRYVQLSWTVSEQINHLGFEIQSSSNQVDFEKIGWKDAHTDGQYAFQDPNPMTHQTRYYRLKQIDIDGNSSYSEVVALVGNEQFSKWIAYPNPTSGWLNLSNGSSQAVAPRVELRNLEGRVIFSGIVESNGVDLSEWGVGVYYLRVIDAQSNQMIMVVKQ